MSTLKVNKLRDTAGSADSITLDPNGGAVIAGVTTVSTVKVGSGVTITSDGDIFHTGVCTATSFVGNAASLTQIPAANIVGVCTSGFTKTGGFGGGIEMAETWRLTSNITNDGSENVITANLSKQAAPSGYGKVGTETMTVSSGVFTFPSTGIYFIMATSLQYALGRGTESNGASIIIQTTTNNSSYSRSSYAGQALPTTLDYGSATIHYIFDVTDVSTHKVRFTHSGTSGSVVAANANDSQTAFFFMKLGDT